MATPVSNSFPFEDQRRPLVDDFHPSKWCHSPGKRAFDVSVSLFLLLCALPLLPIIALLIKLSSSGPVLFVHERVGRDGKMFRMLKFRTMTHIKPGNSTVLTRTGDLRVTELGWHLRRWKLDELPQLFNVIRGDMTFIGPRPHISRLLGNSPDLRFFLALRPGITGLATMLFRHEENTLPRLNGQELESFYISNVLPEKIYLETQYAENASLSTDLLIILRTLQQIFSRKKDQAALRTSQSILARHSRSVLAFPRRLRRPKIWYSGLIVIAVFLLGFEWFSESPRVWTGMTSKSGPALAPKTVKEKMDQGLAARNGSSPGGTSSLQASNSVVWKDAATGRYYCHGSAAYGATGKGEYLSQGVARTEHLEPASRSGCMSPDITPVDPNP